MKKLDTLTYSLAENCLSKNNLFEAKLILNWDKIFFKYSHVVKPIKVQFMKKNNTVSYTHLTLPTKRSV